MPHFLPADSMPKLLVVIVCIVTQAIASLLSAAVVRVEVDRRADVLAGKQFGEAGAYEKLTVRIYFAFEPDNPMNERIVDLDRAPRNAD